jgi:hypothetical protein
MTMEMIFGFYYGKYGMRCKVPASQQGMYTMELLNLVPKHTIHKYKEELLQAQNLMFQQAHSCALILFQVSRKTEGAHFYYVTCCPGGK